MVEDPTIAAEDSSPTADGSTIAAEDSSSTANHTTTAEDSPLTTEGPTPPIARASSPTTQSSFSMTADDFTTSDEKGPSNAGFFASELSVSPRIH